MPEQSITEFKSGVRKKGYSELVGKIIHEFPELNLDSILNGIDKNAFVGNNISATLKGKGVAYYDFEASGGPVEMFNDSPEVPSQYIIVPGMEDCNIALNVWGDSMYPHFTAGDIAVCRKVNDKSLILFGEIYLVVTAEFRTVKYVQRHSDPQYVILRSSNKQYDDVEVHKNQIINLYMVKGKIQRKTI